MRNDYYFVIFWRRAQTMRQLWSDLFWRTIVLPFSLVYQFFSRVHLLMAQTTLIYARRLYYKSNDNVHYVHHISLQLQWSYAMDYI